VVSPSQPTPCTRFRNTYFVGCVAI
jgi:hypothetical protein